MVPKKYLKNMFKILIKITIKGNSTLNVRFVKKLKKIRF